jgi:quinol monooxygenase YgiN
MVLFTMILVATPGRGPGMAAALRPLSIHAQNDRGCLSSRLSVDTSNPDAFHYTQEWATERDLWSHIKSDRFQRLIAVVETAAEQPSINVRLISRSYGFEYVQDVLRSEPR